MNIEKQILIIEFNIFIETKVYAINSLIDKKKKQELYEKNIVKKVYLKNMCK